MNIQGPLNSRGSLFVSPDARKLPTANDSIAKPKEKKIVDSFRSEQKDPFGQFNAFEKSDKPNGFSPEESFVLESVFQGGMTPDAFTDGKGISLTIDNALDKLALEEEVDNSFSNSEDTPVSIQFEREANEIYDRKEPVVVDNSRLPKDNFTSNQAEENIRAQRKISENFAMSARENIEATQRGDDSQTPQAAADRQRIARNIIKNDLDNERIDANILQQDVGNERESKQFTDNLLLAKRDALNNLINNFLSVERQLVNDFEIFSLEGNLDFAANSNKLDVILANQVMNKEEALENAREIREFRFLLDVVADLELERDIAQRTLYALTEVDLIKLAASEREVIREKYFSIDILISFNATEKEVTIETAGNKSREVKDLLMQHLMKMVAKEQAFDEQLLATVADKRIFFNNIIDSLAILKDDMKLNLYQDIQREDDDK